MKVLIYDIEVFNGMFLFCSLDIETGESVSFELSRRTNQLDAMIDFIKNKKDYYFCGFNNINYDAQVIQYIITSRHRWEELTDEETLRRIKEFSNEAIDSQDYNEWLPFKESSLSFRQIDLMRIHHFDNKNRRTPLKWVAFSMDSEDIEELPFPHYKQEFTDEEFEKVISYCWKDINVTAKFYKWTRGESNNSIYKNKDKIQDRLDIIEEFNLPEEAISFSDVKIGDEINKRSYCEIAQVTEEELKQLRRSRGPTKTLTFGKCIPEYIQFKTKELSLFLERIRKIKIKIKEEGKQFFDIHLNDTHYVIAKGGIHTKDDSRIVLRSKDEFLTDADVTSQHPSTIVKRKLYPLHLGPNWLISYDRTLVRRETYKELGKTDVKKLGLSNTFKLALNGGGFGKTLEETSWQYAPEVGFGCTIGNQFEILMLCEMFEIHGIKVISANTDGVLALYNKDLRQTYFNVCKEWEIIVGNTNRGKLEFAEYDALYQESNGHYIAVSEDKAPKLKGRFAVDGEVNKNNTKDLGRIERKAIVEYFSNKIPVEETIRKSRNIYDFLIGMKSTRDYHYETISRDNKREEYKRIIRFYACNSGKKLIKVKNEDSESTGVNMSRIMDGCPVRIMNSIEILPWEEYDIDYQYYINNAFSIIEKIEKEKKNTNQLSLF